MSLCIMKTGRRVRNNQLNNAGYSLVELLVVMGIIAAIIAIASYSISLMFSQDAKSMAVKIDDELSNARMLSMSREGKFTYVLHIDNADPKENYIEITKTDSSGSVSSYEKVSLNKKVRLEVTGSGLSGVSGDSYTGDVKIEFDKSNGSVKYVDTLSAGTNKASGVYEISITSVKNSSKVSKVTLVTTTGRHYMDK